MGYIIERYQCYSNGREAYEKFWNGISEVSVSVANVTTTPSGETLVETNLTLTSRNGTISRLHVYYHLKLNADGTWLFDDGTTIPGDRTSSRREECEAPTTLIIVMDRSQNVVEMNAVILADADLPVEIRTEVTDREWDEQDYERIRSQDPDLIIIHLSAFYDSDDQYGSYNSCTVQPRDEENCYQIKTEVFLKYVTGTHTQFLFYTSFHIEEAEFAESRGSIERTFPFLTGKLSGVLGNIPDWSNIPDWEENLVQQVKLILGLN